MRTEACPVRGPRDPAGQGTGAATAKGQYAPAGHASLLSSGTLASPGGQYRPGGHRNVAAMLAVVVPLWAQ